MKKHYIFIILLAAMAIVSLFENKLFAQPVKSEKIIVFVNDFEARGVSQDLGLRISSLLARKFTNVFPKANLYTTRTILLLKKEVEKQLRNSKNCNAEKCQREISTMLDANFTLSGEITLNSKNQKLSISLMALSRNQDGEIETHNFSVECFEEQLEYFAEEIIKKTINNNYAINVKNAPPAERTSVKISRVKVKEIPDVMIEIKDFKSSDNSEINQILKDVNRDLRRGDLVCKKGDFEECDRIHSNNYVTIAASFSGDKLLKLQSAVDALKERISNAKNNKFNEIINKLTAKYEKVDPEDEAVQRKFVKEFYGVGEKYKEETGEFDFSYSDEMYRAIKEREAAANLNAQMIIYRRGEREFQTLHFERAYTYFLKIQDELKDAYKTDEIIKFQKNVEEQIAATQKSGESYLENQTITALGQASSRYFIATRNKLLKRRGFFLTAFSKKLKKTKDAKLIMEKARLMKIKSWRASAKEGQTIMNNAKNFMIANARFVTPQTLKKYNELSEAINQNKNIQEKYYPKPITSLEKEVAEANRLLEKRIADKSLKGMSLKAGRKTANALKAMSKSMILPGAGMKKDSHSGIIFFAFYLSLYLNAIARQEVYVQRKEYLRTDEQFKFASFLALDHSIKGTVTPNEQTLLEMWYSDYSTSRKNYSNAVKNNNSAASLVLNVYLINVVLSFFSGMMEPVTHENGSAKYLSKKSNDRVNLSVNSYPDIPYQNSPGIKVGQKMEFRMDYKF